MASERASQQAFLGVSALLFAASAAVTIVWCASMSAMGEMPMPGGWTMSMAWMRMPGQTWPGAAASFLGMWVVMMVAMMLPSLVPMLWRYRQAVGRTGETRLGRLTALVGVGYFFVWTVFGMAAFPLGVALAAIEMQQPALARAVPIAVGVVVLIAGALQFTAWKARHLACCREAPGRGRTLPADAGTAWRHGLRLGLHCSHCCAGLMAILLVIGVMDLRAMAVVAAAITVERLAPAGERVARATDQTICAKAMAEDRIVIAGREQRDDNGEREPEIVMAMMWPSLSAPSAALSGLPSLSPAVVGDGLLEVFVLLAGNEADPLQGGQMLFRFGQIVVDQVRLPHVLMSAAMAGVELERSLIVLERGLELATLAIRVAEIVLDVGVARIAERGGGERRDRSRPVLCRDGRFPGPEVRVDPLSRRRLVAGIGAHRRRQEREPETEQHPGRPDADHAITGSPVAVSRRAARGDRHPRSASGGRASRSRRAPSWHLRRLRPPSPRRRSRAAASAHS